jgi:CheY-like chemotaxis protein
MSKSSTAVLVVDDEPMVRAVAVDLFEALGFDVFEANDGIEALRLLRAHDEIGVLFTDVRMPGMNGVELARHAQQIRPDVKVVLTSGYFGEVDEAPDLPLVPKPWRKDDFAGFLAGIAASGRWGNESDRSA